MDFPFSEFTLKFGIFVILFFRLLNHRGHVYICIQLYMRMLIIMNVYKIWPTNREKKTASNHVPNRSFNASEYNFKCIGISPA